MVPDFWNFLEGILNNPKSLDPSYKMDRDFWIVLEGKSLYVAKAHNTGLDILGHSRI